MEKSPFKSHSRRAVQFLQGKVRFQQKLKVETVTLCTAHRVAARSYQEETKTVVTGLKPTEILLL